MIITAKATHISHSPRKVNLVAASIVGLNAEKALEKLRFTIKRASSPVTKVLKQAMANATNNYKVEAKNLVVSEAFATKGRTLKRGLFGGRMHYKPFERTASHLTINLRSVTVPAKQAAPAPTTEAARRDSSGVSSKTNIKSK